MARPTDTILQGLLNLDSCETQTAATITLADNSYLTIATDDIFVPETGDDFAGDLRKTSEIVQSAFANVDRCQMTIENADKNYGLRALNGDFDKARTQIARAFRDDFDKNQTAYAELFSGELKILEVSPTEITAEVVDDLVAAGYCVADWSLADDCFFQFKDPLTCTYAGSAVSCNKLRKSDGGCSGKIRTDGKDQTAWFGGMEAAEEVNSNQPGDAGGIGGNGGGGGIDNGGQGGYRYGDRGDGGYGGYSG